ncbi:MAG: ribosome biogenesis GTPase Der [Acidobacteria bacterium]|nr:ribosome biogenesis GTPase Der [Acidobacteriota bacterium]
MYRIVIVGRPNVGKSTLFNRIAGRRRALVHNMPGMTRDRLADVVKLDDGRVFELIDTGGLEYGDDAISAFAAEIREQADAAVATADLIVFLVDGAAGVVPDDREVAERLRPHADRTILLVNKIDTRDAQDQQYHFYELGFDDLMTISAEHGTGFDELYDRISAVVPPSENVEDESEKPVAIAIIGRPNVGKSSLLNRLTQQERSIVSDLSGTTRDSIDSMIEREGKKYLLIDTAGIRRKGKTTDAAEKLSVISARKAIERCDIALVMIDGVEGVTAQDATVVGYAENAGKAAIILVNKWDIVERSPEKTKEFESEVRRRMKFLAYAPIEFISAKTGRRVEKLFPTIDTIAQSYRARFRTSVLNEILEGAVARHHPPALAGGRARRLYYATQVNDSPPTIVIFSNSGEQLHFSYKRYLENTFRDALDLVGTPIRLLMRSRKGMKAER